MRLRLLVPDATDRINDRDATKVDVMRPIRLRQTTPTMEQGRPARARVAPGFTLIELLVVMVIISILLAFILRASWDGLRRGEERGTQALIAKLEVGITDRIDAISNVRLDANPAHGYLASVNNNNNPSNTPVRLENISRATVIAQFDKLKSEFPDVFYVTSDVTYPLNFAAMPYPGTETSYVPSGYGQFLLPLGVGIINDPDNYIATSFGGNTPVKLSATNPNPIFPVSTGILGASYGVRGGFAKQLGSGPKGYDGVDNDGNGLIDEIGEWGVALANVQTQLANHTHKTARAETLYAVLVSGVGPLGSVFSADDFNDNEVADTDGDGLLEFVDAWGEPLQFFRWPIYYHGTGNPSETGYANYSPATQRGYLPYTSTLQTREQNPLDPNQLLVSPDWWWSGFNNSDTGSAPYSVFIPVPPFSGGAVGFSQFFIPLSDPWAQGTVTGAPGYWDRGSQFIGRREFYSRFLVLSGGADKTPGVAILSTEYFNKLDAIASQENNYNHPIPTTTAGFVFPTGTIATDTGLALIESQAGSVTPYRSDGLYQTPLSLLGTAGHAEITGAIQLAGFDDITNHNLQAPAGATQ